MIVLAATSNPRTTAEVLRLYRNDPEAIAKGIELFGIEGQKAMNERDFLYANRCWEAVVRLSRALSHLKRKAH